MTRICQLVSSVIAFCFLAEPLSGACTDVELILDTKFRLGNEQREEVLALLKAKDPTHLEIYRALIEKLPPPNFAFREAVRLGTSRDVMYVLKTLATEDPLQLTKTLLKPDAQLSTAQKYVLDVLVHQSWIRTRWSGYFRTLRYYPDVLRPSRFFSNAYEYRKKLLYESIPLENFLQSFDLGKYTFLVDLIKRSGSTEEALRYFKARIALLETDMRASKGFKQLYLQTELRKTEAFVALVSDYKEGWRADAKSMSDYAKPNLVEWLNSYIFNSWPNRWRSRENLVLGITAGLAFYTFAAQLPSWRNPHQVIYPKENVLINSYPMENQPVPESERKTIEQRLRDAKSDDELLD